MREHDNNRKLITAVVLVACVAIMQYAFTQGSNGNAFYAEHIFKPFQHFRYMAFANAQVSVGDIFYIALAVGIAVTVVKWIYYIFYIDEYQNALIYSFLSAVCTVSVFYAIFLLGWGGNYYRPTLAQVWQLNDTTHNNDSDLITFDRQLVAQLNMYAPHYKALSFEQSAERSEQYYTAYTDISGRAKGLKVKASVFGNYMEYMSIEGYYNPFTGEAQVNSHLPDFMMPFVVCHEAAHQCGIAAEDDANLMAFAVGTASTDTAFNYSCYFNAWLYTQRALRMRDSSAAKQIYSELNPLSRSHVDTLKAIRKRYHSKLSNYSNDLYDQYLRMQDQQKGIDSYDDVIYTAKQWEQGRAQRKNALIHIP